LKSLRDSRRQEPADHPFLRQAESHLVAGKRGRAAAALHSDHMGMATLGWIAGCLTIWSSLFAIGNFLYGRTHNALILTSVFVVSGLTLIYVVNKLWDKENSRQS
jgi:hypothetical protein